MAAAAPNLNRKNHDVGIYARDRRQSGIKGTAAPGLRLQPESALASYSHPCRVRVALSFFYFIFIVLSDSANKY